MFFSYSNLLQIYYSTQYNRPQRVSPSNNSQNSGAIRNSGSVNIRNNGGINHGSGIRNSGSTNVSRPSSGTVRSGGTNTVGGCLGHHTESEEHHTTVRY